MDAVCRVRAACFPQHEATITDRSDLVLDRGCYFGGTRREMVPVPQSSFARRDSRSRLSRTHFSSRHHFSQQAKARRPTFADRGRIFFGTSADVVSIGSHLVTLLIPFQTRKAAPWPPR